jgi:hypothetical protein
MLAYNEMVQIIRAHLADGRTSSKKLPPYPFSLTYLLSAYLRCFCGPVVCCLLLLSCCPSGGEKKWWEMNTDASSLDLLSVRYDVSIICRKIHDDAIFYLV